MKAMIFAAGLGSRLRPLTDNKPKALIEINNTPLLEFVINRLKSYGFYEIIINIHHFADMIIDFLKKKNNFKIHIEISDERDLILDTGGGLKKASWFFDDSKPFLVHNVDVLSDLDLNKLYQYHLDTDSFATIAVRNRITQRYLLFDDNNTLCGWKNTKTSDTKISRQSESSLHLLANCGIQIIDPRIFQHLPDENVFSIIDLYLKLSANKKISAFIDNNSFWMDVGKKENLQEAENFLTSQSN
jgi:mannose-1-phosphate guanylyltransferase